MVDFLKHMTPEQRSRYEAQKRNFEKDKAEFAELSVEKLTERTEYFMKNCEFPGRYQPGEPVYDGVIAHVVIPELLTRVRQMSAQIAHLEEQWNSEAERHERDHKAAYEELERLRARIRYLEDPGSQHE